VAHRTIKAVFHVFKFNRPYHKLGEAYLIQLNARPSQGCRIFRSRRPSWDTCLFLPKNRSAIEVRILTDVIEREINMTNANMHNKLSAPLG